MNLETLKAIKQSRDEYTNKSLITKNEEYADIEDVLRNFNDGAIFTELPEARYLWALVSKHILCVRDWIVASYLPTKAEIDEKLSDIHNYLYLLEAIWSNK